MSNEGRFVDRNPGVRGAGLVTTLPDDTVGRCLTTAPPGSETPNHVKKYRKSFNEGPGVKQIHFGLAYQPLPPTSFTYGKPTHDSDHVDRVIRQQDKSGFAEFKNDISEKKYASSIREPLGNTYSRNYEFPPPVHQDQFRFGVPTAYSQIAKEVIFPERGAQDNSEQVEQMYHKSHGSTQASQQINRNYNWPVNPKDHRFGLEDKSRVGGVADALKPEYEENTKVVHKAVEDYRSTNHDQLGAPRNLGSGKPVIPPDYVFGQNKYRGEEWDAGHCIQGEPAPSQLIPDSDLGRTNRHGFRNVTKPGDEGRVFGVPSIRSDIIKTEMKSVADHQNYGDEVTAIEVLLPDHWLRFGLEKEELFIPRTKDFIRSILNGAGLNFGLGKFEAVYNKAQEFAQREQVSLKEFLLTYRWFEDQGLTEPLQCIGVNLILRDSGNCINIKMLRRSELPPLRLHRKTASLFFSPKTSSKHKTSTHISRQSCFPTYSATGNTLEEKLSYILEKDLTTCRLSGYIDHSFTLRPVKGNLTERRVEPQPHPRFMRRDSVRFIGEMRRLEAEAYNKSRVSLFCKTRGSQGYLFELDSAEVYC